MTRFCKACRGYGYLRKKTRDWCCLNKDCRLIQEIPEHVKSKRLHNVKKRNPATMLAEDIPDREKLIERIKGLKSSRDKMMVSFLFLTGCRISELVGITYPNQKDENGQYKREYAIKFKQIEYPKEKGMQDTIMIKDVWTLKRRNKPLRRNIPINIENEEVLWGFIGNYIRNKDPEGYLCPITRSRALQIIQKIGIFPHLLRHIRLTELHLKENFQQADLKLFTGWRSGSSAESYIHPQEDDLVKKLRHKQ